MSSDQFPVEHPKEKCCPQCGEMMPYEMDMCWLCLRKFTTEDEGEVTQGRGRQSWTWAGDAAAWTAFGVIAIPLALVLAYETPGLLIVLLVLAVPALVRTILGLVWKPDPRFPLIGTSSFLLFLTWIGLTGMAVIAIFAVFCAAFLAFCVALFVVCTGALGALAAAQSPNTSSLPAIIACCVCPSMLAAVVIVTWAFWAYSVRKE